MSVETDKQAILEAVAGLGDLDAGIEALHRLPDGTPGRGQLAAGLLTVLMRTTDMAADMMHGGRRAAQIDGLLAVADSDPPREPGWVRSRAVARTTSLMISAGDGQLANRADALAEIEKMAAESGGDAILGKLFETARMTLSFARSVEESGLLGYSRVREDVSRLRAMLPDNPETAAMADSLENVADVIAAVQDGGDVKAALQALQAKVQHLRPGAVRDAFEESIATVVPLAGFYSGSPDGRAAPTADELAALDGLLARTDGSDDVQAMRYAVAGGVALQAGAETDVERVTAGIDHFREAVELSPPGTVNRVMHLGSLALALMRRNELTNELADMDAAAEILTEARELAGGPRHPQWSTINEMLTQVQHRRGEAGSRSFALDAMRSTAWQVLLQDGVRDAKYAARDAAGTAMDTARHCLQDGAPADAIQALDGGRSLMLFAATEVRDVVPRLVAAERSDLAERWRQATAADGTDPMPAGLRGDVLAVLAEDVNLLDPPTPTEIQDALRALDADALIYLVPSGMGGPGWAVIAPAEGKPGFMALPSLTIGSDLDVERYLNALANRDRDLPPVDDMAPNRDLTPPVDRAGLVNSLDTLCDWAWRVAIGPIVKQYLPTVRKPASGRPPRLILVPMGELALIPWQAARSPEGTYALEFAAFSQAASARMLCQSAAAPPVSPTPVGLVVGDPDTGGPAAPLVAARIEAYAVHQAFYRGGRYVGRRADGSPSRAGAGTSQEVRDWLAASRAGTVLHLACHGVIETTGTETTSYLMLAGGDRITAQEIIELMTRTPDRGVGLAVLAACRTGRSIHGYDEAYSLGTAFLAGGVRSVLSTLWAVPDQATSVLMFMFHHYLTIDRLPAWEALRQAQLWMLDADRRPPDTMPAPLRRQLAGAGAAAIDAWAGFVHWGQ